MKDVFVLQSSLIFKVLSHQSLGLSYHQIYLAILEPIQLKRFIIHHFFTRIIPLTLNKNLFYFSLFSQSFYGFIHIQLLDHR
jgi:hypothetical protein